MGSGVGSRLVPEAATAFVSSLQFIARPSIPVPLSLLGSPPVLLLVHPEAVPLSTGITRVRALAARTDVSGVMFLLATSALG